MLRAFFISHKRMVVIPDAPQVRAGIQESGATIIRQIASGFPLTRYAGSRCGLRINAVFQRLAWLERNSVAGLDFDGLTGLRVFAGAGAAMALQEGAETHQRDAVFAVQGAGDFFENGVENAVGLLFGEVCFFSNCSGEFWFTH